MPVLVPVLSAARAEGTAFMLIDSFEPASFATVLGPFATACGVSVPAFNAPSSLTEREMADLKRRYSGFLIVFDRLRERLLEPSALERRDGDGWSIREILGHMVDTDREIWWPRIVAMLENDRPFLPSVDQDRLLDEHGWNKLSIEKILAEFMKFRWNAALRMNDLTADDMARSGQHYEFGSISVANVLELLVAHDAHFRAKLHNLLEVPTKED